MSVRRWTSWLVLGTVIVAGAGLAVWRTWLAPSGPRVLLIGLDGAEWDIIDPLIEQGKLPNLARLKREGVYGILRSFEPIISPPIWTSIATGKTPEKHGITWFMVQSEKSGQRLPVTSKARTCQAFWNILRTRDISTGVLGWWATYPAEEVKGFIVTDFIAYHNFGVSGQHVRSDLGKTYPLDLIEEIEPLIVRPRDLSLDLVKRFANVAEEEVRAAQEKGYDFSDPLSHFLHILATAETYTALGTTLFRERAPQVFAVYYEGIDSVGHLFMKYADPAMPDLAEENRDRYSHLVERYYEYQDEALGRYLELAGSDTYVIVVSDHGFKTGDERPQDGEKIPVGTAHLWHNLDGVVLMRGPGMKAGKALPETSVLDITPTLLYALGLPVADDMDGNVILDAFQPSYLVSHKIARVSSYEEGSGRDDATGADENVAQAMEQHLRGLGYVGTSAEDSSPEIHVNLARQHLQRGAVAEAENELKLALRLAPNEAGPHLLLAQIYRSQNRLAEVKKELRYAMSLEPGSLELWMRFAAVAGELGDLDDAMDAVKYVHSKDPDWPGARVALGDLHARSGRLEEAQKILEEAVARQPNSVVALFNLALVRERRGEHEKAIATYEQVLALSPDHPCARNNIGSILASLGRHEEAYQQFSVSVQREPENFEAVYNLGTTCLNLHKLDEALAHLKKAVTLKPDGLHAHKNLAMAYMQEGHARMAFQEYLAMTRLFPSDHDCWVQAARLLKRPERESDVIALLQGAWAANPEATARLLEEDSAFAGLSAGQIGAGSTEETTVAPAEPATAGAPKRDGEPK
ncbi:MAG: tetratricopeptide repeat protein [Planctomycetota bacterium]